MRPKRVERGMAAGAVFLLGVMAGAALVAALLAVAARDLQRQGLRVEVDPAPIAAEVRSRVKAAAQEQLPAFVSATGQEVAAQVADEVARRLAASTVEVGGLKVAVPPSAVSQVRSGVEEALRSGLARAGDRVDTDAVADRLADRAFVMVMQHLRRDLDGRTVVVRPWPWLSVPVTLVVR